MQSLCGVHPSCGRAYHQQHQQQQQQQLRQQQRWSVAAPGGQCSRHRVVAAVASAGTEPGSKQDKSSGKQQQQQQQQQANKSRNARLYELFDDDGWGVEAVSPAATAQQTAAAAAPAKQALQKQQQQQGSKGSGKQRKAGTPFADLRSQEGKLGLTLLQQMLQTEEEQQQPGAADGTSTSSSSSNSRPSLDEVRAKLAAAGSSSKRQKSKLPGFPRASAGASGAAAAAAVAAAGRPLLGAAAGSELLYGDEDDDDDEDYDDDEDEATPAFQITFDEEGRAALESFTNEEAAEAAAAGSDSDVDVDLDDFGMEGWGQFGADDMVAQQDEVEQQQRSTKPAAKRRQQRAAADTDDDADADEIALLRDLSNEDDWGLESLTTPGLSTLDRQLRGGRRSLIDELTAAEEAELEAGSGSFSGSVQWGGTAGTTGIDMEEQEAMLMRYFRPDQVKRLMKEQQEVDASYSVLKKRAVGLGVSDHKLQEKLRIVSGSAAGRKLVSFRSTQTRPMMEKVRQAIFNMLQSRAGTLNCLPRTARWLDLFAGTGSVGLEALSRGVKEAHFVEMDPVVVSKILDRNIKQCGFKGRAWTHTSKAEDFLRRSAAAPRFAGGPFDFISVCPPYLLVSYPELFELLDASPLVHPRTILFVEYPKQLSQQIVDRIGPLQRVRDRRYGRTWVALYAAAGAGDDEGGEDEGGDAAGGGNEDDPFLAML